MTLVTMLAVLAPMPASPEQPSVFARLATNVEQAVLDGNVVGIREARTACVTLLKTSPTSPNTPLVRYTIAYADWRLASSASVSDAEQTQMLEDAQAQLLNAKHDDPWFADELALLYAVYGGRITKNPDLGMTLGPDASEALMNAVKAAPSNPRVIMMQAITSLHAPAEYGGNPARGIEQLRASLKAFDAAPAEAAWPNWGRFDVHVMLGQALAATRDTDGARREYNSAIAIAPNNQRVRDFLAELK
jgi:hypothetical protein